MPRLDASCLSQFGNGDVKLRQRGLWISGPINLDKRQRGENHESNFAGEQNAEGEPEIGGSKTSRSQQ